MNIEKLGNIAIVKNGFAFKSDEYVDNGIRVIRITNVQKGKIVDSNPQFVENSRINEFKDYLLNSGDILVSLTGNVGRVGILTKELEPAVLNQRVACIRVKDKNVCSDYVFQYLNSSFFEQDAIKNSNGIAQLNLSTKWIENYEIPLPPLEEQIQIATVLSKAENLITKRKKTIELLDEFVKSTFLEMFGDPVRNEKGWEKKKLYQYLNRIDSGWSPICENFPAEKDNWGVLKLSAVTSCIYNDCENKSLPINISPKVEKEVQKGDVLFTRKNTKELVAACAYVFKTRKKLMMSDTIFRLEIKERGLLNPIFLWKLLCNDKFRKNVQNLASGSAGSMPNISKQSLLQLDILLPPLPLQNQFAEIVNKVEVLKEKHQKSLEELENLYGSLSQKAFRGEL